MPVDLPHVMATLQNVLEYAERYADLNEEPRTGNCRHVCAEAHGLVAGFIGPPLPGAATPAEVWLVTDRRDDGTIENETAVFRTREAACAQARAWIEEYRNHSRVAGEIDGVLAEFDEAAKTEEGVFGAGDGSCVFWVEVCRFDVRG